MYIHNIYIYIYILYMCVYIYIYIHIYIEREREREMERERERDRYIDRKIERERERERERIYACTDTCLSVHVFVSVSASVRGCAARGDRRREEAVRILIPEGTAQPSRSSEMGDWQLSCDVLIFGSFQSGDCFFGSAFIRIQSPDEKMIDNNHITW